MLDVVKMYSTRFLESFLAIHAMERGFRCWIGIHHVGCAMHALIVIVNVLRARELAAASRVGAFFRAVRGFAFCEVQAVSLLDEGLEKRGLAGCGCVGSGVSILFC
jgi:hypothetical protein